MNPLNHFGIKSRMIRGDTSSYNNEKCPHCRGSGMLYYQPCDFCGGSGVRKPKIFKGLKDKRDHIKSSKVEWNRRVPPSKISPETQAEILKQLKLLKRKK